MSTWNFFIFAQMSYALLPSYEVNIESCQENNLSRVDNLMFTSYEGNNYFIKTWMFCFSRRQQNNFWYKKKNYGTGLKKNGFSTHFRLLGVVDWATTYSLPLHYICLGCPLGCFPRHHIFCKTSKLSYYFYIVNKYVRYNNVYYPLVVPFDIFCQQEVN